MLAWTTTDRRSRDGDLNAVLLLGQRRRLCANIRPPLAQCLEFARQWPVVERGREGRQKSVIIKHVKLAGNGLR